MYGELLIDDSASFPQALLYFHRLLASLPVQHADRPWIYYCLGRIYRFIGKNDRGFAYLRCAKLMQSRNLPQSAFAYGSTLAALGIYFSEIGNSTRAVEYYERAMAVHRGCLPHDHSEMVFHANRLAFGYWQDGQYERGLAVLNNIELIHKQKLPTNHRNGAQTLHTKGLLHHALGNQTQAFEDYQEALKLREAILCNNHPYVARTCYRLGLLHEQRGEYSAALEQTKRALHIQQAKYLNDHWEVKLTHDLLTRLEGKVVI
jgi:tetratricopeptide (TPR) repeat protein